MQVRYGHPTLQKPINFIYLDHFEAKHILDALSASRALPEARTSLVIAVAGRTAHIRTDGQHAIALERID